MLRKMDLIAEYQLRAIELERLAREVTAEKHRQLIMDFAATWRMLSAHRARMKLELIRQEKRSTTI